MVKRNLRRILGQELEEAVIVDRSARCAGPVDGPLVVNHKRSRPLELHDVTVLPRRGPGHVGGDMPMPKALGCPRSPANCWIIPTGHEAGSTGDIRALRSQRLIARAGGEPLDAQRIAVFEALATDLLDRVSMHINALPIDEPRRRLLAF